MFKVSMLPVILITIGLTLLIGIYFWSQTQGSNQLSQLAMPDQFTNSANQPTQTTTPESTSEKEQVLGEGSQSQAPAPFLEEEQTHIVTLTTNFGEIIIELFHNEVPTAANNFAFLAKEGFYDGLTFHRIVENFMIQGGDPNGDGTGGPGYRFPDEAIERDYDRGIVAYANSGPNTSGSQFFIMHQDYPLPKDYVIFGQVVEGIEVVDQIATVPVTQSRFGEPSQPIDPVLIESAELSVRQ